MFLRFKTQISHLGRKVIQPGGHPLLYVFLAAIFWAAQMWGTGAWYQDRLMESERLDTMSRLIPYTSSLNNIINQRLSLLSGVKAFVESSGDEEYLKAEFPQFAQGLYASAKGVRSFAVFPNGIGQYVYPFEGNEAVIGYNVFEETRSELVGTAQKAISTQKIILVGPVELVQGGRGLIARQAVFKDGEFWGLVSEVIDIDPLFAEAGITAPVSALDMALTNNDGLLLAGKDEVLSQQPVDAFVQLNDQYWKLSAVPAGGWTTAIRQQMFVFQFINFLLGIFIISLLYSYTRQIQRMQRVMAEQTAGIRRELEERRRTEQQLSEERDLLSRVMETTPVATLMLDASGKIVYFNSLTNSILGGEINQLLMQQGRMPGLKVRTLDGEEIAQGAEPFNRVLVSQKAIINERYIIEHRDQRIVVSVNAAPLFDHGQNFSGVVATLKDITTETLAEDVLRESEARYRGLVEKMPVAIFVEVNGKFVYLNPAAVSLFNAESPDELIGKRAIDFIHPDERNIVQSRIIAYTDDRKELPDREGRYLTVDGKVVDVEVSASPLQYENQRGALIIARDISERKQKERLQNLYQTLFSNVSDVVILVRLSDGCIFEVNQAAERVYGYSHEELLNMRLSDLREPSTRADLPVQMHIANERGLRFETMHQRKDGQIFPVEINTQGLTLDNTRFLLGVIRDISDRKNYERWLTHQVEVNAHLLEVTQQRSAELELLADISTSIRKVQTKEEMFGLILNELARVINASAGGIAILNGQELEVVAAYQLSLPFVGLRIPHEIDTIWDVIRKGEPVWQTQFEEVSLLLSLVNPDSEVSRLKTFMILPLKTSDRPLGLLVFGFSKEIVLSEPMTRLANAIAEMGAIALQRITAMDTLEQMVADRTKDLEGIYNLTSVLSEAAPLADQLEAALQQVLLTLKTEWGAVFLLDESKENLHLTASIGFSEEVRKPLESVPIKSSLEGWVVLHNEPLFLPNITSDERSLWERDTDQVFSFISAPMRTKGIVIGALTLLGANGKEFNLEEMSMLSAMADQLALMIENSRLRLVSEENAKKEERSRLARELHDSVTQALYSASLFADASQQYAQKGDHQQVQNYLGRLTTVIEQALKEMRLLIYELREPLLYEKGLEAAFQQRLGAVEGRAGVKTHLTIEVFDRLPEKVEDCLYRIGLEALNNALKHAGANQVELNIQQANGHVCMTISDNGKGFDPKNLKNRGVGLSSMQERVDLVNGSLKIESEAGKGTNVIVNVPINF